jgi:hypothetical protein
MQNALVQGPTGGQTRPALVAVTALQQVNEGEEEIMVMLIAMGTAGMPVERHGSEMATVGHMAGGSSMRSGGSSILTGGDPEDQGIGMRTGIGPGSVLNNSTSEVRTST